MNVRRMSIPGHVKRDVNPLGGADSRVNLILQPVLGDLLLNHADIPTRSRAKITAASGDTEPTLRAACGEGPIWATDWTALAECDLILLWFRRRLGLRLRFRDLLLLGLDLCVLALNVDGVRLFLFNFWLRLSQTLRFVG